MSTYKIQFGVFGEQLTEEGPRPFIPIFEHTGMTETEVFDKMTVFFGPFRFEELDDVLLHRQDRSCTFLLDELKKYGYRVIKHP